MNRPTRRKAWLALAIVAALTAVPAAAAAAPAAIDEYVLDLHGVRQVDSGPVAAAAAGAVDRGDDVQRGVVGEREAPPSPLASLGDTLGGLPPAIVVGLLALLGLLLLARPRPIPHAQR